MRVSCLQCAAFHSQGPIFFKSEKSQSTLRENYPVMWSFFLYASRNQETLRDMLKRLSMSSH